MSIFCGNVFRTAFMRRNSNVCILLQSTEAYQIQPSGSGEEIKSPWICEGLRELFFKPNAYIWVCNHKNWAQLLYVLSTSGNLTLNWVQGPYLPQACVALSIKQVCCCKTAKFSKSCFPTGFERCILPVQRFFLKQKPPSLITAILPAHC